MLDFHEFAEPVTHQWRYAHDPDLWNAATARTASARLLTTDKDFDHLAPELVDVGWIEPGCARACANSRPDTYPAEARARRMHGTHQ